MKHDIKCEQPYFDDIWNDEKTLDIRYNDRNYKEGDYLIQRLYDKENGYIDKMIICKIYKIRLFPKDFDSGFKFYVMLYFNILGKFDFT